MKKILTIILSALLMLSVFNLFACTPQEEVKEDNGTVSVRYYSSGADMLPLLKQGVLEMGVLPEPAATNLTKMASDKTWYRLSIQELYNSQTKEYPQAVLMVKESLLNTYASEINAFATQIDANITWAKQNKQTLVETINSKITGFTPTFNANNLTDEVIDNCNVYYQSALDGKQSVKNYLRDIISLEPTSAKQVSDDYFYNGTANGTFANNEIKVFAPDGAPALAIAKYIYENQNFGLDKTFNYNIVKAEDIGSKIITGAGDIVILPVNASSKLYKAYSQDSYKMVSVVTHGNLYLMSSVPFVTLADKTVGVIGQGLVPDLTFRTILNNNKLKVSVKA